MKALCEVCIVSAEAKKGYPTAPSYPTAPQAAQPGAQAGAQQGAPPPYAAAVRGFAFVLFKVNSIHCSICCYDHKILSCIHIALNSNENVIKDKGFLICVIDQIQGPINFILK